MLDIRLIDGWNEMLEKCAKCKDISCDIQNKMNVMFENNNKNNTNYKLWNANDLHVWIVNIQNSQKQFIFNEYSYYNNN